MKRLVVAFSGPSNSGKTTLIAKLIDKLSKEFKVCAIKHDPKDKAIFDQEGKDSYKFFQSGANVALISPKKSALFFNYSLKIEDIIEKFGDFDYLFIEGLKYLNFPRIGVFREEIDPSYYPYLKAVAIDKSIDKRTIKEDIDILDLNNIDEIIEWIDKNAKEL